MPNRPILVTGSHRSGSTWVGRMLAAAPSVAYIHEPFSVAHRPGICSARFPHWFPYICRENESEYLEPVRDMLAFKYKLAAELPALRSPKDAGRLVRDAFSFTYHRRRSSRPLLKDPIAIFSAEWLCDRFDMDVVVLVRHPAAFAGSLKKLGWTHPFGHFLEQPLLIRDWLAPFEAELRDFAKTRPGVIEEASLLWSLFHHVIAQYRERRPKWIFLRHEDVARDPVAQFRQLFNRLGLEFTDRVQSAIWKASNPSNLAESDSPAFTARDSVATATTWASRLSGDEVDCVRLGVEAVSRNFYSDSEW